MANHVIYDRIWESRKLSRCSLKAALAYPWLYLVADDWGRFEFDPRSIWGKVFSKRRDVRESDVQAWLSEYEQVGLMDRYEIGDLTICAWVKFVGPPPSKRKAAMLPAPDGSVETEGLRSRSRFHSAADQQRTSSTDAAESQPLRSPETGSMKHEAGSRTLESGSEQPAAAALPFAPPVVRPSNPVIDRGALEADCLRLVREIAALTNEDGTEIVGAASEFRGRKKTNPALMGDDRLAHTVIALRSRLAKLRGDPPELSQQNAELVDGVQQWLAMRKKGGAA